MADNFCSSLSKMWRIQEEEDDDDFPMIVDDQNTEVVQWFELENAGPSRRMRRPGALPKEIRPRDHTLGHARILADYFGSSPVYSDMQFRRRFRMRRPVFMRILEAVEAVDGYFRQKEDALGRLGLTPLQKVVACIRILAYGIPADAVDEYVRIGDSTARKSLRHFCKAAIKVFGDYYLRAPNAEDVARLLRIGEACGFPGMLGSIDCMHWEWRNCPTSWKGQFTGRGKHPSMILEAVASYDLWIWHAYFGMPGSCNDINVIHRSPVFSSYLRGQATPVSFNVNGHTYDMGYYLADGIYPDWSGFVKAVRNPKELKTEQFTKKQEGARKMIERSFGVLQSRWAVIRGPAYGYDREQLGDIMTACIIMHNMIIEDEGKLAEDKDFENIGDVAVPSSNITEERADYINAHHKLRNRAIHNQLQVDLIEHNWRMYGAAASGSHQT